jgi:hypothetical protein
MPALNPFGPERTPRDAPDAAAVAEETVATMLDHARRLNIDAGDCAAMVALDCISMLNAYGRASLPAVLAAIAEAAPSRVELLVDAQRRGVEPPPLSAARLKIAANACRLH